MSQKQADEQYDLATQLHEQMFNQEPTEVVEEAQGTEEAVSNEIDDSSEEPDVPHDDDIEELRKFKARYLSLQGKYDAEVPRLHSELKEFKQSVFDKLEQVRTPQHDITNVEPVVDKFAKFKEEYGEDLFEAIKELAASQAEEKLKSSLKPVQEQVSNVEDTQIKAAQQNFTSYLDTKVVDKDGNPRDWKNLWDGNDAKFIEFLSKPEPNGLFTYGELVQHYNDNWDADKLGTVFNTYFEQSKPVVRQPNPSQQAIVAPSRQNTHTTPSASDKMIWTREAQAQFERDDRQGKYTPEESQAKWNDLLAAMGEGRVR